MSGTLPILFLITDLHLGGAPRVVRDLAIGLQALANGAAFAPRVISLKPLPAEENENQKSKIDNESIPGQLRAAGIRVGSLDLAGLGDLPGAVPRLVRLLNTMAGEQGNPGILYSILIHANALATAALPFSKNKHIFIQSIHTLQPRPAWHWTLEGLIARRADALIVPAKPILDKIAAHGPFQRGIVIPNGIDLDRFAHAQPLPAAELPWPAGARVIGYLGRFDPVKNLPLLLRAFARLIEAVPLPGSASVAAPQIHLALVGYGPEEPALRQLATSLHIAPRVHFVGPTTVPERWYKSFSCHCLPSTAEGFGLTLVEAAAAGLAVVAMRTAVTAEIFQAPLRGRLVERPDEWLLAQALRDVIAENGPSPSRPTEPHSPATGLKRYAIGAMVERHAEIFKEFCGS